MKAPVSRDLIEGYNRGRTANLLSDYDAPGLRLARSGTAIGARRPMFAKPAFAKPVDLHFNDRGFGGDDLEAGIVGPMRRSRSAGRIPPKRNTKARMGIV